MQVRLKLLSPISKTTPYFKAVSINNGYNNSENTNAIAEAKEQIKTYVSQSDFSKVRERKTAIEKQIENQKNERLKSWFARTFQEKQITDEFVKKETEQKYANNEEKAAVLSEVQSATDAIDDLVISLENRLNSNDAIKAARNKNMRSLSIGKYRTNKGFSQIAGYENEKEILYKYFISEIEKERMGYEMNIPNAVLFFGPKGNGKTTFATAFAQEIGCEKPIKVSGMGLNPSSVCKNFYKNLNKAAEAAKKEYETTGKRQVLFIDEFDLIANEKSTILPELEEFLTTCYDKYHCIVFAATNYPLQLKLNLSGKNSIFPYIVSQDPPTKENKIAILKYYLKDKLTNDISQEDYELLAKLLEDKEIETGGKYSIAQIRNKICEGDMDNLLDIEKIKENIEKSIPNIKDRQLKDYYKAMDTIMKNKVED